jgi:hypothetical protein
MLCLARAAKHQVLIPNPKPQHLLDLVVCTNWNLDIGFSLVLGVWCLVLPFGCPVAQTIASPHFGLTLCVEPVQSSGMKRDIELIRLILLREQSGGTLIDLSGYDAGAIAYNSVLAIEAGLLRGQIFHEGGSPTAIPNVSGITWAGHDFLDATRDSRIWKKVRNRALALGTTWDLLREYIDDQARQRLEMRRR